MNDKISSPLLQWFAAEGRHDLPWQHPRTPYRVWVSEIMLQQTQVTTAIPYFNRFIETFPTVEVLATAHLDTVLAHWSGLGYYARARNLHKTAGIIVSEHGGQIPADLQQLQSLPGIGRTTAGAILAQGFNQRATILDGNVKRVLTRYEALHGWPGDPETESKLWHLTDLYTPNERIADYTQAIMDLGATLCKRNRPTCDVCPLNADCKAYSTNKTKELPSRKPRKTLPNVERYILIKLSADNEIFMERRPNTGIWGGLFSFPESSKNASLREAAEAFGICPDATQNNYTQLSPIRHTFSHYHLLLKPLVTLKLASGQVEEQTGQWFKPPVKAVGIPAPIEKWLNNHDNIRTLVVCSITLTG